MLFLREFSGDSGVQIGAILAYTSGLIFKIDPDFLTMEMVISKPFGKVVRSQLESLFALFLNALIE